MPFIKSFSNSDRIIAALWLYHSIVKQRDLASANPLKKTFIMKRFSLFLALCLAMSSFAFASTSNNADDNPIFRVKPVETKAIQVNLANLQQVTTSISLTDLSGKTFFKETIRKHNGYAKKFDLEKIPNGRYVLTVKQDGESYSKVIYVDNDAMRISGITK